MLHFSGGYVGEGGHRTFLKIRGSDGILGGRTIKPTPQELHSKHYVEEKASIS